jgi:hypothetical protein
MQINHEGFVGQRPPTMIIRTKLARSNCKAPEGVSNYGDVVLNHCCIALSRIGPMPSPDAKFEKRFRGEKIRVKRQVWALRLDDRGPIWRLET